MSKPLWTASERQALLVSMQHFGACICQPPGPGRLAVTCDGHRFLGESDRRVDRPEHLLYVRRTRQTWIDAEWMHIPPPQGEIIQPVLPAVVRNSVAPEPEPPDELPW